MKIPATVCDSVVMKKLAFAPPSVVVANADRRPSALSVRVDHQFQLTTHNAGKLTILQSSLSLA
jgi:hypothetical protein